MARSEALNIENAWNSVALEERLNLVSFVQARALVFAAGTLLLTGTISYGFDQIWGLGLAVLIASIAYPTAANHAWRRKKPELILEYLAARSVARRYAFGYRIRQLDVLLIFRGEMTEQFDTKEEEILARQQGEDDGFEKKPVWICLLRGGVVLLSERLGGARLEFIAPIGKDYCCAIEPSKEESEPIVITGAGPSKGRRIEIDSKYPAAKYVFRRQISRLVAEIEELNSKLAQLSQSEIDYY